MQHTLDKTVSVIVPVYNAEKWLDRCVNSLVKQSYRDISIVLVDDGSTDDSPAICDKWAKRDKRVFVLHQANTGVAKARENGLQYARSTYIGFVDSDDYIKPDMYEKLLQVVDDADIVECGWYTTDEIGENCISHTMNEFHLHGIECLRYYAEQRQCKNYLWNKLYKADLFHHIKTEKYCCGEDTVWNAQLFMQAKSVVTISEPLYYYVQQAQSICHEKVSRKRLDGLKAWEYIYQLWEHNTPIEQHFADYAALVLCSNAAQIYMQAEILPPDERKFLQDATYTCFSRYDRKKYALEHSFTKTQVVAENISILSTVMWNSVSLDTVIEREAYGYVI